MSEKQRERAKRLFKAMQNVGLITSKSNYYGVVWYQASPNQEWVWINKLTEAIAIVDAQELENEFNKQRGTK